MRTTAGAAGRGREGERTQKNPIAKTRMATMGGWGERAAHGKNKLVTLFLFHILLLLLLVAVVMVWCCVHASALHSREHRIIWRALYNGNIFAI